MRVLNVKAIILIIIAIQIGVLCDSVNSFPLAEGTGGKSGESQKQLIEKFGKKATAVISGTVSWTGHNLSRATMQIYKDKNFKELYCSGIITSKDGSYEINVEPGQYYVLAFVDENRNNRFDPGDGIGIYGITDWSNKSQKKKPVKVGENETQSGINIKITAMVIEIDGQNQVVPVDSEYAKQSSQFKLDLSKMFTGISGKLTWPGHKFENALVFVYTDLTWKYRVATSECDEDGNFKLNLLPGKYYLLAVIDENQNNIFDAGDEFGIYGVTDSSSFHPQPLLLEKNKFVSKIEIPIVGLQDKSGKIVFSSNPSKTKVGLQKKVELSGKINWQGHDLKNAAVFAYKDPTLMTAIGYAKAKANGQFKLELPAGKYYLIANVDADGDGKYSAGDGIGGYGTDDITKKHPAEFVLSDKGASSVGIPISAKYDKNGQLVAVSSGITSELGKIISSGISGKIIWDEHNFGSVLIAVSETPKFNSATFVPIETEKDGSYILPLNPGDYYVMAVVDTNGDNVADVEDGIGIYCTRMPTQNYPQLVSVFENRITPYIDIDICGVYIDKQNIAQIDDAHRPDIRKQYGEPEDIFRFSKFGRQLEEWWYWTQGVMFSFEKAGAGWKLDNREEFKPSSKSQLENRKAEKQAEKQGSGGAEEQRNRRTEMQGSDSQSKIQNQDNHQSLITNSPVTSSPITNNVQAEQQTTNVSKGIEIKSINTPIYYTYDGIVWGVAPNEMQQPLGIGKCPTASGNNEFLSMMDTDGNIHLIDLKNKQDKILLKRNEMASAPSISPDGKYLAFVRKTVDRSQIFIKHISTGEEIPLPSTSVQVDTPAWSSGGLIAYAASGNIENPNNKGNWNIYTYDIKTRRIDSICATDADESEPAWSPTEYNVLAFSRSEGNHRQIWLVTINQDGTKTEQQLTEFGGRNPAWLPDGSAIIYENNGQLWIVDIKGRNEEPLLIDDKPVFGLDPFAGKNME